LFFAAHQAVPVRVYSRDRRSANRGNAVKKRALYINGEASMIISSLGLGG